MFRQSIPWIVWGITFWGTLRISDLSLLDSHHVCGVWGCGPPTNALLACHLGWFVFLMPIIPGLLFNRIRFPKLTVWSPWLLISAGVAGVMAVGAWEYWVWYPEASETARRYFLHRWMFSVIILTDLPVLELPLVGIATWLIQKLRTEISVLEREA